MKTFSIVAVAAIAGTAAATECSHTVCEFVKMLNGVTVMKVTHDNAEAVCSRHTTLPHTTDGVAQWERNDKQVHCANVKDAGHASFGKCECHQLGSHPNGNAGTAMHTMGQTTVQLSTGRCGPNFGNTKCTGKYSGADSPEYCNEANGWCGTTSAHKNAQASTTYDYVPPSGRCGPLFGHSKCTGTYSRSDGTAPVLEYCNEANGWCGTTSAHKNAQASTKYDYAPPKLVAMAAYEEALAAHPFTKTAGGGYLTNAAGQTADNFSKNGMTITSCSQECRSLHSTTCHGFSLHSSGRCALWVADHTKAAPAGFEKYNSDSGNAVAGPFCSGNGNGWDLYTRDSVCKAPPGTFTKHAGGGWLTDSASRNPDNFSKNNMTPEQCETACHTLRSTTCHGFSSHSSGRCALWVTEHTKAAPVGFSKHNSDSNNPSTGVFCSGNGNGWDLFTRDSTCKAPTGAFTKHTVSGWLVDASGQVPDNISKNAMTLAACEAECHNMKATTCHGFSLSTAGRCAVWVADHAKAARASWSAYNSDANKLLNGPLCTGNGNGWALYTKSSTCPST
jgi:hypothetical protein